MAAARVSLILDLGGGDRVLQEYGRDLQLAEFCEAIGVKPLALCFTGPEPGDFDSVIATWKAGYFRPERSILILNEYLVPQIRPQREPSNPHWSAQRLPKWPRPGCGSSS